MCIGLLGDFLQFLSWVIFFSWFMKLLYMEYILVFYPIYVVQMSSLSLWLVCVCDVFWWIRNLSYYWNIIWNLLSKYWFIMNDWRYNTIFSLRWFIFRPTIQFQLIYLVWQRGWVSILLVIPKSNSYFTIFKKKFSLLIELH